MTTHELILKFIKKYFLEHCYAPSYEEIVASTGISKATLHGHMKKFFRDGDLVNDLKNDFGKARAYRPKGFKCIGTSEEKDTVISYMKELEKYKQLGTLEEFQALIEMATPKIPDDMMDIEDYNGGLIYKTGDCPECGAERIISSGTLYCRRCGQHLDWGEEE